MEYFVVLFGIRYDSHWRRSQLFAAAAHVQAHVQAQHAHQQPSPSKIGLSNQNLTVPVPNLPNVETPVRMI